MKIVIVGKKIIIGITSIVVVLAFADIGSSAEDCLSAYINELRGQGFTIEYVTQLKADPAAKSVTVRFSETSKVEQKVVTVDLKFDDNCQVTSSDVVSTIYIQRSNDGSLATKMRYKMSEEGKDSGSG